MSNEQIEGLAEKMIAAWDQLTAGMSDQQKDLFWTWFEHGWEAARYALRPPTPAQEGSLRQALLLACARIADGPQEFHEANTAEGWAAFYLTQAGATPPSPVPGYKVVPEGWSITLNNYPDDGESIGESITLVGPNSTSIIAYPGANPFHSVVFDFLKSMLAASPPVAVEPQERIQDHLDFEFVSLEDTGDLANVGDQFMRKLNRDAPDFDYLQSPVEWVTALQDEIYELSKVSPTEPEVQGGEPTVSDLTAGKGEPYAYEVTIANRTDLVYARWYEFWKVELPEGARPLYLSTQPTEPKAELTESVIHDLIQDSVWCGEEDGESFVDGIQNAARAIALHLKGGAA